MANETLYAGIADLRTAEALSSEYLYLLADRTILPDHPALIYLGDSNGETSLVKKVSHIGLGGYDSLAVTADGASVGNTSLTDSSTQVTLARYSKSYERSDMARMSDSNGLLSPRMFAEDAIQSGAGALVDLVANLVDGFATTVSDTGVNADVSDFIACINLLEVNNVAPPYLAIFHPVQVGDIRTDIAATSGGAIQWDTSAAAQMSILGNGFRGSLLGVQIFSTTRVPTANSAADRAGGVFGRGAIAWADSSWPAENDPNQIVVGGQVLFERDRTAKAGTTAFVTHRMLGASEVIDLAGVTLITDA